MLFIFYVLSAGRRGIPSIQPTPRRCNTRKGFQNIHYLTFASFYIACVKNAMKGAFNDDIRVIQAAVIDMLKNIPINGDYLNQSITFKHSMIRV